MLRNSPLRATANPVQLSTLKSEQLSAMKEQADEALARRYLKNYMRQAWDIIEPSPFVDGWHLDAIIDALTAVKDGTLGSQHLILNVPPRHTKSLTVEVMFPSWMWIDKPETRFLCSSYAEDLSIRDSIKCRSLIQSNWYQRRWSSKFALSGDQNAKTRFNNDRGGYRLATSVGGMTTGEGGDIICLPYDALIETQAGQKQIGDIVTNKENIAILSFDHEQNITEYQQIETWQENPAGELVEIELEDGSIFRCTDEHPVFTRNRGYVAASQLTEDDECLVLE